MESPLHQRLRRALSAPNAPKTVEELADFYRHLGRSQESTAWQRLTIVREQANVSASENMTSMNTVLNPEHQADTSSDTSSAINRPRKTEPLSR
jgi:hypothetical protein